jgi:hypothetical protein
VGRQCLTGGSQRGRFMQVFSTLVFVGILMLLFLWLALPVQAKEGKRVTRGELAA